MLEQKTAPTRAPVARHAIERRLARTYRTPYTAPTCYGHPVHPSGTDSARDCDATRQTRLSHELPDASHGDLGRRRGRGRARRGPLRGRPVGLGRPGGHPGPRDLPRAQRAAVVRGTVVSPHAGRLPPLAPLHRAVRLPGRPEPARRARPAPIARRAAECAHPLLSPGSPPQPHGDPARAAGRGAGGHRPDLHQPGVEHDLCLVSGAVDHPHRSSERPVPPSASRLGSASRPWNSLSPPSASCGTAS